MMDVSEQIQLLDTTLLSQVATEFPDLLRDGEKAVINAYLVLSHAILEEYVEDEFEDYVERLGEWVRPPAPDLVPSEVALFCLSVGAIRGNMNGYAKTNAYELVMGVRKEMQGRIRANNGVKTANVQALAKVTGLDWPTFESALSQELADLETLGASRGEAGHLSPFTARSIILTEEIYPGDVRDWVDRARLAAEALVSRLRELPER